MNINDLIGPIIRFAAIYEIVYFAAVCIIVVLGAVISGDVNKSIEYLGDYIVEIIIGAAGGGLFSAFIGAIFGSR